MYGGKRKVNTQNKVVPFDKKGHVFPIQFHLVTIHKLVILKILLYS